MLESVSGDAVVWSETDVRSTCGVVFVVVCMDVGDRESVLAVSVFVVSV